MHKNTKNNKFQNRKKWLLTNMGLESQSTINPRHKSRPIKANQPSIAWIKFITPSSSFGSSLKCPVVKLNPRHKSRPIKADQPSIAWIKFITPLSFFESSLECPVLESAQIS